MRCFRWYLFILLAVTGSANANQFCFALAETYYEQIYCQLQAKAQTKNLPPFNQFRKNSEQIQASLLKRPAQRNGIQLPLPISKTATVIEAGSAVIEKNPVTKPVITPTAPAQRITPSSKNISGCELLSGQLHCAEGIYKLTGNQSNRHLATSVLSTSNSMSLPVYKGGTINQYLSGAYQQYILKMCEIGLCGVTMTYSKFTYLYQDIKSKGLDFSQRFETMYSFLKKDKTSMSVSESVVIPQGLTAGDCSSLGDDYYVCEKQGRNFIFIRQ